MKKSLLALAVLGAFAGAASAQSSVTIYGVIDVGVSKLNNGTSALTYLPPQLVGNADTWTVRSTTSSRLGFRGTEDLGGGLRANFAMEHRLAPDSGESEFGSVGFWHAQSWVGLSGGFGEVRLGRQYIPAFYVAVLSDPWTYDYNHAGAANFTRGGNPVTRVNNAVTYKTPNMGGLSAEVQVAASEGGSSVAGLPPTSPIATTGRRNVGANVQYGAGPLWVGLGYNELRQVSDATENYFYNFGAAYDFGVIRPMVGYSAGKAGLSTTAKTKNYFVGAWVPLGSGRLKAVVARYDVPTASDTTKFGLGYEYMLSKRTSIHADVGTAKTENATRTTGFETGIKHSF